MAKVSIGLRGWRFEESEVFTDAGEFKPLDEIPDDPRHRLIRLPILLDKPCDACYLDHGDEHIEQCRQPTVVYGEPLAEVLVCDRHEIDFLYWFREAGGREFVGEDTFADAFHEWYAEGNHAPEGSAGLEHVDTDPDALPDPPDQEEIQRRIEATAERAPEEDHIDIRELAKRANPDREIPDEDDAGTVTATSEAEGTDIDDTDDDSDSDDGDGLDEDDIPDLSQDYPTK
ncbi:hypothetical protein [Salinirubrum litoreum]|uniref:Uncharacterized protein n=1 Tax=Salinirubrum litoreum TaxID=1126234 RepID=A0ABD5RA36_9EURY|nr:hypothetical protein [Salinirubrum litoreum]